MLFEAELWLFKNVWVSPAQNFHNFRCVAFENDNYGSEGTGETGKTQNSLEQITAVLLIRENPWEENPNIEI